jgi:predicted ATPase
VNPISALQSVIAAVHYSSGWGLSAELRVSENLENLRAAVVAMDDGRFAYQVFLVCGEPRTLLTDSARYLTLDDAARAGYEDVASMSETPVRRPYAPSSLHRKTAP